MITHRFALLWVLALFHQVAYAQFNIFDQVFGNHGRGPQQPQQPQNVPSDSNWYRSNVDSMHCDKYLCPDTLACVHFPHHCPCQFPSVEDKVELADGLRVCVSRGGFKDGEAARKIDLARMGLL